MSPPGDGGLEAEAAPAWDGCFHLDGRPYCVKWSPDGALLAAGDDDSRVHVLDVSARTVRHTMNAAVSAADALPTLALCWRPSAVGRRRRLVLLEGNCAGFVNHWHVPSAKRLHATRQPGNAVHCADYTHDGWAFATSGKDACVRVYEEATKSELLVFRGGDERGSLKHGHVQQVFAVRFHDAHAHVLASAGWDKVVHVWDVRVGASVSVFSGPFVAGDCIDMHGNDLLAGSHGRAGQVQIFDLRRPGGTPTFALSIASAAGSHDGPCSLYACKFSRDAGRTMIGIGGNTAGGGPNGGGVSGGTGDGLVRVYDRARQAFVESLELRGRSVYSVDFAPPMPGQPARLAFAAGSKLGSFVRVLDVAPSQIVVPDRRW